MTDKELTARIAELNAQRAALKMERDKLVWEEGIPAIIAKMKRYGKMSLNLSSAAEANICLSHNELWRNLSDGHFAVKQLCLDENDNLIVVFNALLLNEKSAMKDWVFDRENIKRSVDEEISNAVIAPLLSKLLDDALYSDVVDISSVFEVMSGAKEIDLSSVDTSKVTDMHAMFQGCTKLTSLDLSPLDTSKVTDMHEMFKGCHRLEVLDLSSFDTSKVTDMNSMFGSCEALTSLDLSPFDTSKVTNMSHMFENCQALKRLDISSFNTSAVTDMSHMFEKCWALGLLDLSPFDTSKVTNMSHMFESCQTLTSLD
ncbi:BspA family leucine-rich repeat surface protein, partial [uncultured Duncaniella sp.]